MKQNKKLGIILLALAGMALLGGFANGTFSNLSGKNPGYYVGLFGGLGALVVVGLMSLFGKKK